MLCTLVRRGGKVFAFRRFVSGFRAVRVAVVVGIEDALGGDLGGGTMMEDDTKWSSEIEKRLGMIVKPIILVD